MSIHNVKNLLSSTNNDEYGAPPKQKSPASLFNHDQSGFIVPSDVALSLPIEGTLDYLFSSRDLRADSFQVRAALTYWVFLEFPCALPADFRHGENRIPCYGRVK